MPALTRRRMAKGLPNLTARQFEFVQGLLSGKTASDSYRAAYNCAAWLESSVWCEASKLKANTKVTQWLDTARATALGDVLLGRNQYLVELHAERDSAKAAGNLSVSLRALELVGKVEGHFVERKEIGVSSELVDLVRQISSARAPLIDITPRNTNSEPAREKGGS